MEIVFDSPKIVRTSCFVDTPYCDLSYLVFGDQIASCTTDYQEEDHENPKPPHGSCFVFSHGYPTSCRKNALYLRYQKTCIPFSLSRTSQNNPTMLPVGSTPIASAAGFRGKPGMVIMSPVSTKTNSAPKESQISRTGIVNPVGAPFLAGSDEKLYCVFAMQIGK